MHYKMEKWSKIDGFDYYRISNHGKVKSLARTIKRSNNTYMRIKERILKTYINQNGYEIAVIQKGKKGKHLQVHRLIALAFIPNPKNKPFVNHINGIKTDNRLINLEWCTRSENEKHAHRIGLKSCAGENHSQSILTRAQVLHIRSRKGCESISNLAKSHGVSYSCIKGILSGRTWKHL